MNKWVIFQWAPVYWSKLDGDETTLTYGSEEYQQIAFEVRRVICNYSKPIGRIVRIQNVFDLAQCLVRGQLLTTASPMVPLFRVRRFIKIHKDHLPAALQWNLDHRRCNNSETVFKELIPSNDFSPGEILLVVQVLTQNPHAAEIRPNTTLEYFIDYVVYF
ncbi:unnamed protein product [Ceutorhynchus assimilis]|uniref:Uncharacterized protein n=1 Tax=Ceutorhynchus assimilis TaxID=467358 RepID=A0A9N9MLF0_9CUCU|nr:unnamed protein product [Ceutorhynchus assimilis]